MTNYSYVTHNLNPIFDSESRILLLGSMPSVQSRKLKFYYAHPQNRFWKVLYQLFQEPLEEEKEKKIEFLHRHHIALWDVIRTCKIENSKDSTITEVSYNDLSLILKHSKVKVIFTTGKKAYELLLKNKKDINIPIICLPSTSSLNCANYTFEQLVKEYQILLNYLQEE